MPENVKAVIDSLLREAAEDGLVFHVRGTCMAGYIPDNSRITVRPIRLPFPGDVVVVRSAGRRVVHRVIGLYRRGGIGKVLTQADHGHRPDAAVALSSVLGKVIALNGERITVSFKTRVGSAIRFVRFVFGAGFLLKRMRENNPERSADEKI
ncbi:MAG: hypothetical protein DSY89_07555 [Deltaproteobacteria bacterium]|nr:MAG: hypothetical protein DSY89_07555 [Deltaproteobacteria bacterium]